MRQAFFIWASFAAVVVGGCNCNGCANDINSGGHSRSDGGSGAGGGNGPNGFDASQDWDGSSDGTATGGTSPGGFSIDGGNANAGGDGVKLDPNGYLVLNSGDVELHYMWIANNSEGTVSKFDTKDGRETARYVTAIPIDGKGNPHSAIGRSDYGNSPSRTAIDLYGDVWVANRAVNAGILGTVTKIANDPSSCIDRNGNGVIDTSKDLNGDGDITPNEMITPTDWNDPRQYDECILFTTPMGDVCPSGCVQSRAIAISAGGIEQSSAGSIWVGNYNLGRFYKLRATDGVAQPVDTSGTPYVQLSWGPYGATVDSQQRLWAVQPGVAHLALIDTQTGQLLSDNIVPPSGFASPGAYAIGIDGKNRVWLPGWGYNAKAARYDPGSGDGTNGTWTAFDFSSALSQIGTPFGMGRGIAADDQGYIWMSGCYGTDGQARAQIIGFDAESGLVKKLNSPSGQVDFIDATDANSNSSIGVGLDGDGNPWINNGSGNAFKIDRNTGAILRTQSQAGFLYTYSDFTGYQLRHFTAPRGTYHQDFSGCGALTNWVSLKWDAITPAGTSIEAYVKVASTPAGLSSTSAQKFGPFVSSPVDLKAAGVPAAPYARAEFILKSLDASSTPALQGFELKWQCGFN